MQAKHYHFHTSHKYMDSTVCFLTLKEMLKNSPQISPSYQRNHWKEKPKQPDQKKKNPPPKKDI